MNLDPVRTRSVILQAGAYCEHEFTELRVNGAPLPMARKRFKVRMAPSAGSTLDIGMDLFVSEPRFRPLP